MSLCLEACVSGTAGESHRNEAGSSCLHFGVRSYLHTFYEECSSSMWDRDPGSQGLVQSQRWTLWWNSAVWKVSLAVGLLILTAGISSLSVGFCIPQRIESFGEGDLFFVDTQAVSFNKGLHLSAAAGICLTCFGSGLIAMGVVVRILPRSNLKGGLSDRPGPWEQTGKSGSNWWGLRVPGDVVTEPPEEGKMPTAPLKWNICSPALKDDGTPATQHKGFI
ncbi:neurensin 1-like [Cheilinus undulatus]|uniref:neurensin 1-like n=1 Tax=Cheilinus undulatus TaxID=241271 RepID=UPI001BD5AFF5|nr:neurensin 1-like [Cheilinus undulatus]